MSQQAELANWGANWGEPIGDEPIGDGDEPIGDVHEPIGESQLGTYIFWLVWTSQLGTYIFWLVLYNKSTSEFSVSAFYFLKEKNIYHNT